MSDEALAKMILEELSEFDKSNDEILEILRIAVNLIMFDGFKNEYF